MVKDELNLKLLRAIEDRDLEEAQEAIDLGANVNDFAVANGFSIGPNAKGETFMREEDALENGGTLEHFKVKRPFLIHAIEQEDLRMINLLLANGAKIDCEEIKTYTDGPNVGTEIKTTLKSALESNGLDIKKSLIGGKAKVTISKKLIKDAKKILKNQKMEKNVQVSNGVDSTKYVSDEPYGGRLYHRWVAPFEESKNPIRDLKKSIKKQAKIDDQKRETRQRDL